MGRIYFHGRNGERYIEAVVTGFERSYFDAYISRWFCATLDIPRYLDKNSRFFRLIPEDTLIRRELKTIGTGQWNELIQLTENWLSHWTENDLIAGDRPIDLFETQLNTAYAMGSDPIKLMARLHGQCSIHCYVEGHNRRWLAEIINKGLQLSVFRRGIGWEKVIDLLISEEDSPVVTSYSVARSFPNPVVANFEPVQDEDGIEDWSQWEKLSLEMKWYLALKGLRSKPERKLELTPDNWDGYYFGMGWDAFKLNHLLTIPPEQWSEIAKIYEETQLPATEAWEIATRGRRGSSSRD